MSDRSPVLSDTDDGETEEWLTASETIRRFHNALPSPMANITIATRAHVGLLRTRAALLLTGPRRQTDVPVPADFWWAKGYAALKQNWDTGDFSTWINQKIHMQAFGVCFNVSDLRVMMPAAYTIEKTGQSTAEVLSNKTGRPAAEWWEDMLIDICRRLYVGDLQPKKQADIQAAMEDWISNAGKSAAESIVRIRASKLWRAISKEADK